MSNSLSNVDQTIFDEYVKKAYQANGFMMRDAVRLRTDVQGTTVSFRKVGSVTAEQYAFNSAVVYQDPGYNKVDVNLVPYRAPTLIDDLQQFLFNFDERKEDAELIAWALGRRSDQLIIDAVAASGTTNVIPAGGTGLTYAKLLEVNAFFNDKAIPTEERHIAISSAAEQDLLKEDQFTSSFYSKLDTIRTGSLNGNYALGMKFHVVPAMSEGGLPKTGNIRTCYAWHKMAVGMATGKNLSTIIERVPHLDSWQVLGKLYAGAVAVDPTGIIAIEVDESV
jgi:hypothetical protein